MVNERRNLAIGMPIETLCHANFDDDMVSEEIENICAYLTQGRRSSRRLLSRSKLERDLNGHTLSLELEVVILEIPY